MLTGQAGRLRASAERRTADIDSKHGICLTFPFNGGTCENIEVCPPVAGRETSTGCVSGIRDANPTFPTADWVSWDKSLHISVRWE